MTTWLLWVGSYEGGLPKQLGFGEISWRSDPFYDHLAKMAPSFENMETQENWIYHGWIIESIYVILILYNMEKMETQENCISETRKDRQRPQLSCGGPTSGLGAQLLQQFGSAQPRTKSDFGKVTFGKHRFSGTWSNEIQWSLSNSSKSLLNYLILVGALNPPQQSESQFGSSPQISWKNDWNHQSGMFCLSTCWRSRNNSISYGFVSCSPA